MWALCLYNFHPSSLLQLLLCCFSHSPTLHMCTRVYNLMRPFAVAHMCVYSPHQSHFFLQQMERLLRSTTGKMQRERDYARVQQITCNAASPLKAPGNSQKRRQSHCGPNAQVACCQTVSSRHDREHAPLKSQQYGCLRQADLMTFPFSDPRIEWITLAHQCSTPKTHPNTTLNCIFLGFNLRDFESVGQYRVEGSNY